MHRPRTPEGQQRAPAPVDAPLHRDPTQRAQHGRVGHPHDAERSLLHGHVHGRRERRDDGPGRTRIEPDIATDDPLRIHVAQHQIGVAHRGPIAPAGIAGGPGVGAGALRPDREGTVVEPGDGAAARPDGLHRDHGLAQGSVSQRAVARNLRLAVEHEADVGGGTAHVEADGMPDTEIRGDAAGGGHSGRGPGGGKPER